MLKLKSCPCLSVRVRPPDCPVHLPAAGVDGLHQLPRLHRAALQTAAAGPGGLCRLQAAGRSLQGLPALQDHLRGPRQAGHTRQDEDRPTNCLHCIWVSPVPSKYFRHHEIEYSFSDPVLSPLATSLAE